MKKKHALTPELIDAMETLRRDLPEAASVLNLDPGDRLTAWTRALDLKLLPRLNPDFPLLAAVCGGGSAGKSTLFNSLVGQPVSPTGGRAGLNRRVLAALRPEHLSNPAFMDFLQRVFGARLDPLDEPGQLLEPGPPLYWSASGAPSNIVLMDTPDIDTGSRGLYANRELAQRSLEAADLFIYIFTNATYNNRDNTDFMAALLSAVGTRPCFLVYRAYPSFTDAEIREHARTVAANIYGSAPDGHVLGVYRADEDNDVAAGLKPMRLRPVASGPAELSTALAQADPMALRERLVGSVLEDAVAQAAALYQEVRASRDHLTRYADLIQATQRRSVQQALSHFPTDRVLRRFADIWQQTDPTHIKIMRRTGRVIEWPYKLVFEIVRELRAATGEKAPASAPGEDANPTLEVDLLAAANLLQQGLLEQTLHTGDHSVAAHPAVHAAQARLRDKPWKSVMTYILSQKDSILSWSDSLESELRALADDLRQRMGLWGQIRQTFAALLNVIPATAAITYVLHTGDPIGATGIKIKLTGILGLNDLVALIAIPATAGLTKADQAQLELLLRPVARTWLAHKLQAVQELFESQISGELLATLGSSQKRSGELAERIERALSRCKEAR